MSLNSTPTSERIHIGFFGLRNSGKSSLVNSITNQEISIVSDIKGTTTDPVRKSMELLPLGPVLIIDTPGFDDEGILGKKRVEATKKILQKCDIAILVTIAGKELSSMENELIEIFKDKNIPYIIAKNKVDLLRENMANENNVIYTSAINKTGIEELKNAIGKLVNNNKKDIHFIGDFVKPNDFIVLVTPIDSSAPKGRMILPQQMAIREILDFKGICIVTEPENLKQTLENLNSKPALVVTDSQAFKIVDEIVPKNIPLTSFSILMARYKGFLDTALKGVKQIENLQKGANILISEGCTHHRQCEDIGTVKIPKLLQKYTDKDFNFEWSSGNGFPSDLSKYDLIIHCGGCMLNERELQYRMNSAIEQNIPFTNYGTAIAYMNGILARSIEFD